MLKTMTVADRLSLYETAFRKIHEAIAAHVRPNPTMTKDEFILAVLSAADDKELIRAVSPSES